MVYDNTEGEHPTYFVNADTDERGYAIHEDLDAAEHRYSIYYTDNGCDNGNFVASTNDLYYARRIAHSLDMHTSVEFDHAGNLRSRP